MCYNPDEIIPSNPQAFRLFEAMISKEVFPCTNGSEGLCASKIFLAHKRGRPASAALWLGVDKLQARLGCNGLAVVEIDQNRFRVDYDVAEGTTHIIRRGLP